MHISTAGAKSSTLNGPSEMSGHCFSMVSPS
jgi:hypothetical protein